MNTTAPRHQTQYTFTTCTRCGYIISHDEELCEACKDNKNTPNLALW